MAESESTPQPQPGDSIVWRFTDEPIEKIMHYGNCHCGAVLFKFPHERLTKQSNYHIPIKACNCSICTRNGYLMIYPDRSEIEWLRGWNEMTNYRFGRENRDHKFCRICGSGVCIDFLGNWQVGDVIGINVRMLQGVDIDGLHLHKKKGAATDPPYQEKHVIG